jgi:uncharacterized protein
MKPKLHVDDKPYVVRVLELPTKRTFEVPGLLVDDWLRGMPMRDAVGAPNPDPEAGHGVAELELYADGRNVYATGTFHGWEIVACSRCVGPARLELNETLHVTFMPEAEMPKTEPDETAPAPTEAKAAREAQQKKKRDQQVAAAAAEDGIEVVPEDLDLFPFDGERVDLEPLLREQFVLAVPYAPLCREDCKGLCPQCGVDRNAEACGCEKPIDPRLLALKGLKLPS